MSTPFLSTASVTEVLAGLVAISSVNPSLVPSEGVGETAIAEYAHGWLNAHGVTTWLEEAAPGRPNVVSQIEGGNGPTMVLCAHLDTVGTAGMTISPFEARVDGDRLYGRGAYDMKGSAAAIMLAMATLASQHRSGRVMAALVADEEYASVGAFDFVRRHAADACIVTEPSEGALVLAHKGFVWAEIVATGRAAHGSRWDLGVSAIGKIGRVAAALEQFDRTELRRRVHPLVGPASLHCALVEGGTGLSTYAQQCRLKVERRTLPGETPEQVRDELQTVVRNAGEDAHVEIFFARDPLTCDPDSQVVSCVRHAVTQVVGQPPKEVGVGYWMDAAVFGAAGIPTVNYGPSGAGAHEPIEWVDISSVVRLAQVLVEAVGRFCRSC
jgi:acetylornithine deacetylase